MYGDVAALNNYLVVGAILFSLGLIGFVARRNLIVMFLCAELMLQGVSVTLVGFGAYRSTWSGQVFAIFSLALAAAEAAIALALIVMLFRRGHSLDVSLWQDLRDPDQPAVVDEKVSDEDIPEPEWPHLTVAGRAPAEHAAAKVEGTGGENGEMLQNSQRSSASRSGPNRVHGVAGASRGVTHDDH